MGASESATQIRGSGLLLAGRLITLAVGFVAQVIIVRYLTKGDFGAFAFALSIASLAASLAAFGLDKATSRFLPIYAERDDRARILGLLLLAVGLISTLGIGLVLVVYVGQQALLGITDPTSIAVLVLLIALVPIQALDPLLTSILAALSRTREIFVRRYLMEPVFELTVLAIVILAGAGVAALALGYVVAGIAGLALYAVVVVRVLRRAGYLTRDLLRRAVVPWREVLSYSTPLLSSDLVFVLRGALVVILLEVFGTAIDVADFRAVFPQARLNLVVLQSFTFLYLPLAARLNERADLPGLQALHRRTSTWVALMSFPVFAASLALAGPVVGLLYGEQYATSAPILAILSAGFFASAVLGFGGLTLRAIGRVRYLVTVDLLTAAGAVAAYLLLIPTLGALGAAIGTTLTLIAQAVAYHVGAQAAGGADRGWGPVPRLLVISGVACVALAAIQAWLDLPLWIGVPLVTAAWAGLLWWHRGALDIAGLFPEIGRVPVLGPLLAGGRAAPRGPGAGGRE